MRCDEKVLASVPGTGHRSGSRDFHGQEATDRTVEIGEFDSKNSKGAGGWAWTPILYAYDIAKGSSKRQEDVGHMAIFLCIDREAESF